METKKINFVLCYVLLLAFGMMSFNVVELRSSNDVWFPVSTNGTIQPSPMTGEPEDDDETCSQLIPENVCAVKLPANHTYTNISETGDAPTAGRTL